MSLVFGSRPVTQVEQSRNYIWDTGTLTWIAETQPGGSSGVVSTKTPLTPAAPTSTTVGASTGLAIASNVNRKGLILTNTSNNVISIGLGQSAVLNSGITLYPAGTWVMDEYTYCTSAVNAIASAGSSNLTIQEFNT